MDNTQNLLLSELSCASGYIERIFNTVMHMDSLYSTKTVQTTAQKLNFELTELLETNFLLPKFINEDSEYMNIRDIYNRLRLTEQLLEAMIKLSFNHEATTHFIVNYINKLYHFGFVFHDFIQTSQKVEIEYPRMNLIESIENDLTEGKKTPLFALSRDKILRVLSSSKIEINSLKIKREEKYDESISKAHNAAFDKNYQLALESFHKALSYKETAEVYTLIGWVHSLLDNLEDAKKYCVKAINIDPDYGAPFNDLGSYLLKEGSIEEALKWFEKAKMAVNYQNREYPYINSGRAYMSIKNVPKALNEFSMALTLAPYHKDLHNTVEKLKRALGKENSEFTLRS